MAPILAGNINYFRIGSGVATRNGNIFKHVFTLFPYLG